MSLNADRPRFCALIIKRKIRFTLTTDLQNPIDQTWSQTRLTKRLIENDCIMSLSSVLYIKLSVTQQGLELRGTRNKQILVGPKPNQ